MADWEGLTILIVDDMPDTLRLLSQTLTQHGYKTRVANTAARVFDAVQAKLPDLILLDIMMPDMDGYEVCARLKANPGMRDIPVIFISALHQAFNKVKAFAAGGLHMVISGEKNGAAGFYYVRPD